MPGPYIAIIYNALCDSAQGVQLVKKPIQTPPIPV